jgi:GT2 family glycosyltransferase
VSDKDFVLGTVAVGFCSPGMLHAQWRSCYTSLYMSDSYKNPRRITGEFSTITGGIGIPNARNNIVRDFLNSDQEWLWFTDTDSTYAPDIIDILLEAADPVERPIMGGLAFRIDYGKQNSVGAAPFTLEPTIYYYDNGIYYMVHKYPKDAIIRCSGVGAHCLLIHRSVLSDERWLEDGHYHPWFRMWTKDNKELSEDLFFCDKAQELGYPIHVCTAAKTGHVKSIVLDEDLYLAMNPGYLEAMEDPNWKP